MRNIKFIVPGRPMAKGSKRIVTLPNGRPMLLDSNKKAAGWQAHVTDIVAALKEQQITGPVAMVVNFVFDRPKAHFHTSKKRFMELRDDAPQFHTNKPDADKLLRTLGDGITNGGLLRDDCLICKLSATKVYGCPERTEVTILAATQPTEAAL